MEDGSDLLTRIVRAELPAFTDLLLESLLNQEDLQVFRKTFFGGKCNNLGCEIFTLALRI